MILNKKEKKDRYITSVLFIIYKYITNYYSGGILGDLYFLF